MKIDIKQTSDDNFDKDVLKSKIPVLLDFWAKWCGPCKIISTILKEIAEKYKNNLKILKINIDENNKITSKFNIKGIPTLIFFKNGILLSQKVGLLSKGQLINFIEKNLSKKNI